MIIIHNYLYYQNSDRLPEFVVWAVQWMVSLVEQQYLPF